MAKRPLVPILVAYLAALAVSPSVDVSPALLWVVASACAVLALIVAKTGRDSRVALACALLCVVGLGILRHRAATRLPDDHVAKLVGRGRVTCEGVLAQPPRERLRVSEIEVETTRAIRSDGQQGDCCGRVVLLLNAPCPPAPDGGGKAFTGRVGDVVRFAAELEPFDQATNPGEFCPACFRESKGLRVVGHVTEADVRLLSGVFAPGVRRLADSLRARIATNLNQSMAKEQESESMPLIPRVAASVVYGMHAAPIPENIENSFRRSGTIHLLVVSGTQVAFIAGSLLALCGFLPRWARLAVIAPALLVYLFVTLQPPSIVRATMMGLIAILAILADRDFDPLNALAFTALLVLAVDPMDLHDLGLQLSFAACTGIILLVPLFLRHLSRLPKMLAVGVSATFAAQLGVAPLLAYHFGSVPVSGFGANMLAIPVATLLLSLGVGICGSSLVSAAVAKVFGKAAYVSTLILIRNAEVWARPTFATLEVRPHNLLWPVLGYGALIALALLDSPKARAWLSRERLTAVAAAAAALGALLLTWKYLPSRELEVTFLDVGQGDSIVIRSPSGRAVLIDGGSHDKTFRDVGERIIVPFLAERGLTKLEAVLLTHPHEDHVNGLDSVLRDLEVREVWDTQQKHDEPACEALLTMASRRGVPIKAAQRGESLDLGGGVTLWMLWPPAGLVQGTTDDVNNNSLVAKLTYGEVSFLLTGDLEEHGERLLLSHGDDLRSTILKAGHHGAPGTSSAEFLRRVEPKACVLSVGRNNAYGHPGAETVRRLRGAGARIYQTDLDGAVTFRTDGRRLRVTTFRERHRHWTPVLPSAKESSS